MNAPVIEISNLTPRCDRQTALAESAMNAFLKTLLISMSLVLTIGCRGDKPNEIMGMSLPTGPTFGVAVEPKAVSLEVGTTRTVSALVVGSSVRNRPITWSTSAPGVATAVETHMTGPFSIAAVVCHTAGSAQIVAAAVADSRASASVPVTCTAPPPPPRRSLVILSPELIGFSIITACSQRVVGVINIRNVFAEAIGLGFRSDHRAVTPFVAESSLQPGADGRLSIVHDCSGERVDGIITVTATAADGTTDVQSVRVEGR